MPPETFVCNTKLLFYIKNIGGGMMVQNCLKLLKDMSSIERDIAKVEKKINEQNLDVDYKLLLSNLVKEITDK